MKQQLEATPRCLNGLDCLQQALVARQHASIVRTARLAALQQHKHKVRRAASRVGRDVRDDVPGGGARVQLHDGGAAW
jgi:hypothetical protein